jgi:thiol-disulfide isomerase/thioredoxin
VPVSEVDRDGIGWMKFVFQREGAAEGGLRLGGRRIGAEADDPRGAIQSRIPDGYGTTGVQATAIGFPAEGCWEIIAASGTSQLRFRTWVEIAPPTVADLVGETAPTVELAALDGGRGALPVAPDRPTVVTFWGSWCPACTREPDMLAELAATGGVDVVLVAVKDVRSEVSEAVGRPGPPVLLDPEGSAFAAYGGFGLPLTVFIDRAGVIRSFVAGPLDAASIAAGLEAIAPIAEFNSEPSGSPIPVRAEPAASPAG